MKPEALISTHHLERKPETKLELPGGKGALPPIRWGAIPASLFGWQGKVPLGIGWKHIVYLVDIGVVQEIKRFPDEF